MFFLVDFLFVINSLADWMCESQQNTLKKDQCRRRAWLGLWDASVKRLKNSIVSHGKL